MFVDRAAELAFLQERLTRTAPYPAQLLMVYGRRRVGKTALLRHWAAQSGLPHVYWMAQKEPAPFQRRKLFAALTGRPPGQTGLPTFESWSDFWDVVAPLVRDRRQIVILDEVPYAAEADSAMLSALQYAWDIHFQQAQPIIVLCGSHVRMMESLLYQQSPLFGRMTGQWYLQPLPFGVLRAFFPAWSMEEQVAAYAMVGGVPAYLSWFDPTQPLTANIRQRILAPGSLAMAEVEWLLADEVREPRRYLAILQAIGSGAHTLSEISAATLIATTNLTSYLATLQELRLVARRLPATIPPAKRRTAKQGRYHLRDPFHRFYFRFLAPQQAEIAYAPDQVLPLIQQGLWAFVGQTAWEELARQWVRAHGAKRLGGAFEQIGSYWSRSVQADVVAISWQRRALLVGECKWTGEAIDRQVARDLLERTMLAVQQALPDAGTGWIVTPALFVRSGVTEPAAALLAAHGGIVVDLPTLYADLAEATSADLDG